MLPVATISVAKYLIFDALFFHHCICQTRCKCIFRVFAGSLMYSAFRITISSWSQMCEKKKKTRNLARIGFVLCWPLCFCSVWSLSHGVMQEWGKSPGPKYLKYFAIVVTAVRRIIFIFSFYLSFTWRRTHDHYLYS